MNTHMNKYVISDIHGCLITFKHLLKKIHFSKEDKLFILGDLIDRGPDSKGVIDYIWELQREKYQIESIRGNHDQMMLDSIQSMKWQTRWLANGGWTTFGNFNVHSLSEIPAQYFHYIKDMPYFVEEDGYILVHAGLNFDTPHPLEDCNAMLWARNWYQKIDYSWLKDRIIIHGHTPIPKGEIASLFTQLSTNQYLNIDAGCVFKNRTKGLGVLTCFDMNRKQLIFQENLDF